MLEARASFSVGSEQSTETGTEFSRASTISLIVSILSVTDSETKSKSLVYVAPNVAQFVGTEMVD